MDSFQAVVLALLQGLTEFLPISSSAHLILLPRLAGWEDQGLAFDVAVHVGTLTAVVAYFRHEVIRLLMAWSRSLVTRKQDGDSRLAWFIIMATLPAAVAGLLLHDEIETWLRSPLVIALATIVFGLLLGWADFHGKHLRNEHAVNVADVILIGLSQALALIPGTSRSGITITTGLALGLTRSAAARFSFLMSIPIIAIAGGYEGFKLAGEKGPVEWDVLLIGTAAATISAYLCIHFFLRLIERIGMLPFVIYRLVLGCLLLWMFV